MFPHDHSNTPTATINRSKLFEANSTLDTLCKTDMLTQSVVNTTTSNLQRKISDRQTLYFSSLFGKHSLFFEVPSTSSYEPSDVTLSKEINQQQIVNIFCPKIKTELSLYTRIYSSYPIFSSFSLIFFGFSSFAILSQSTLSYLLI